MYTTCTSSDETIDRPHYENIMSCSSREFSQAVENMYPCCNVKNVSAIILLKLDQRSTQPSNNVEILQIQVIYLRSLRRNCSAAASTIAISIGVGVHCSLYQFSARNLYSNFCTKNDFRVPGIPVPRKISHALYSDVFFGITGGHTS